MPYCFFCHPKLPPPISQLAVPIKDTEKIAKIVPGHIIGDETYDMSGGPRPAKIMLVTKSPSREEAAECRYLVGNRSAILLDTLRAIELTDDILASWYVSVICKWPSLNPASETLPQSHIKECQFLLEQELRLVRPDYILCLGSDAGKWFLGTAGTVTAMIGRCSEYQFATHRPGEEPASQAKVVVCHHPAAVFRKTELQPDLREQLLYFKRVLSGERMTGRPKGVILKNIYKLRDLQAIVARIRQTVLTSANPLDRIIAVDGEWEGGRPWEEGSYLRTIQFSASDNEAYTVVLRHEGGSVAFKPGVEAAIAELAKLLKYDPAAEYWPRIGGHFFRSDLPWLKHQGLDLLDEYAPPNSWQEAKYCGGWDTAHMVHAHNETANFGLTDVLVRWTSIPVYDEVLKKHVASYCKAREMKKEALVGYGFMPKWILHPEYTDPEGDWPYARLAKGTTVQLADGSWAMIDELVKQRYSGKVRAFLDGKVVGATVTGWHRHVGGQKEWRQLVFATSYTSGRKGRNWIQAAGVYTPDHEILTQRGKIKVSDIEVGVDGIVTDEVEFSTDQLSVFLGSLLGDGGIARRNGRLSAFRFSQCERRAAYAHWKAEVFRSHGAARTQQQVLDTCAYITNYRRYCSSLLRPYPLKTRKEHNNCKLRVTPAILAALGDLGLAVWYQDDCVLVRSKRDPRATSCRIAFSRGTEAELALLLEWFTKKFGPGVTYNPRGRFFQFVRESFYSLQRCVSLYMHPVFAYKTIFAPQGPHIVEQGCNAFCDPIIAVVPKVFDGKNRGHGVREVIFLQLVLKGRRQSCCFDSFVFAHFGIVLGH